MTKIIVSETIKPPAGGMGGSVHDWERSLDPWHSDAFKGVPISADQVNAIAKEFSATGDRKSGWMALDWCGNPLGFVADGTEIEI